MVKLLPIKGDHDKRSLPTIIQAHSFVCRCFGITEKELDQTLQRLRKNTPNPDQHIPRKWSRKMPNRAEAKKARSPNAVLTIQREALYDRILREDGKPLFSFTGKITHEIVFSLLGLYEKILPKLDVTGALKTDCLWVLVEHVIVPTAFIKLVETHRSGLGAEFQGENCWYLPAKKGARKQKPIPRVLNYWFRTSDLSTGHRASRRFVPGTKKESDQIGKKRDALKKRFERWQAGEDLPTLFDLHKFVDEAATDVSWLDDPAAWKSRFTLAFAMQNVCDAMDDLFQGDAADASLKIADLIKQLSDERIVCDDEKYLAEPERFFAARLWQLKLQRDGNWETLLTPAPGTQTWKFPGFTSIEADDEYRKEIFRQMSLGNRFLQAITNMAVSDGVLIQNPFARDDYLFEFGVSELNRIINAKRKGAGKRSPASPDASG